MNLRELKDLLLARDPAFWNLLTQFTGDAAGFSELVSLSALRRKALKMGVERPGQPPAALRLAILGGCSLYPLHEILEHLLDMSGTGCALFLGDYNNYVSEILDAESALYRFGPQVVLLLPGPERCQYPGAITDSREVAQAFASGVSSQLLDFCRILHERSAAEILLGNFSLPVRHDPGAFRTRTLASDWNFRKYVNMELGLNAPPFVRLLDLEFLASREGGLSAEDPRGWFQSKQPCSPSQLVAVCREACHLIAGLRTASKKVLVLDLDNTLWGGVVADEGADGIEVGDTSPRGEAFKAFQKYIRSLKERGVLLAVCSKNDHDRAVEPFETNPEMVLRTSDFISFQANWEPKSDNLRRMAADLNLGLDSFVFVDDNPAEIDIVRQFVPAVTTVLLGADPAGYVGQLQDCRLFEPHTITAEDAQRTGQYRAESDRKALMGSAADMAVYLDSLRMEALVADFTAMDAPRLAQLINKSNQFNLTTRRRTEAEVRALIGHPDYTCFSVRLQDRFGDHGLIAVVIGHVNGDGLQIDTWLMSCRVLKRQVEEAVLNELVRRAQSRACRFLEGVYVATPKNEMVRDHYPGLGFQPRGVTPERGEFVLEVGSFEPRPTKIQILNQSPGPL